MKNRTTPCNHNPSLPKLTFYFLAICLVASLAACTNYNRQRGVESMWRQIDMSKIVPGETTQMDIARELGPPSQVIDLAAGPVFYYLSETTKGGGLILIIFNNLEEKVSYDRAIFFFDKNGVLKDYALSKEPQGSAPQ